MPSSPLETWTIDRGTSPWRDFTRSYEEELAGRDIRAVSFAGLNAAGFEIPAHLVPPGRTVPLLAIDRAARRVVVNAASFGDLARIDATSLATGETRAIGRVHDPEFLAKPRSLVRFLIAAQVVQTYVHLDATVSLVAERDDGIHYRAACEAVHTYYTSTRHDAPYAFVLGLDRGRMGSADPGGDVFVRGSTRGDVGAID